ncbi:MAG: WYL domain-containing protein [Chloroflexota bacterium]|nr:WYL domain-containing protein [Chloroflexota bacterium]
MRAYRMLSILLLMQSRGNVTAGDLAERLEVSRRTVYRDMEALAAAGAPIYAERGHGGGWRMLEGSTVDLPGLDEAQMRALKLGGRRDLLDDLGLRGVADFVWARLDEAQSRVGEIDDWLLVEDASWRGRRDVVPALPEIQRAVFGSRRIWMRYERAGEPVERTVDPLGLVAKGSIWYLVAAVDGEPRTYRVSRVLEANVLAEPSRRPEGFRLRAWWDSQRRDFAERLPRHEVQALARGAALDWLRFGGWYATVVSQSEPRPDGFRALELTFDEPDRALAWAFTGGMDVILLAPVELRDQLAQQAEAVLTHLRSLEQRE